MSPTDAAALADGLLPAPYKAYHYADFHFTLPDRHRYPLPKHVLLRQATLDSGLLRPENVRAAPRASDEHLALAHTPDYLARTRDGQLTPREIRQLNLPWSAALYERSRHLVGATVQACRAALADGIAFTLGGGAHHAFADHASGFCVFNDVAIAARLLHREGHAARVLIFDCDVHQGDGTAAILHADPHLFTCSIHCATNFPFHKQTSDLDVELPNQAGDAAYLAAVGAAWPQALAAARPQFVIYIAGADPYAGDRLGRLAVSQEGLAARDRFVIEACCRAGVPVAVLMGGGYAERIEDVVSINMQTIRTGVTVARARLAQQT